MLRACWCLKCFSMILFSECTQSKIDLMFLVDGSESITVQKFETVKNWIINVASGFDISEPVQVGVVSNYIQA